MVYGVRPGATLLLNPQVQPPAQAVFDPITRRAVRYIETVVPTVFQGSSGNAITGVPADIIYQVATLSGTYSASGTTSTAWDTTNKRAYRRLGDGASSGTFDGASPECWYTGWPGNSSYAPKNVSVTQLILEITARFNNNVDYTTFGFGLAESASTQFNSSAQHWIQVLRNAGSWEVGSSDGTTLSQTSGGTGDGSWHVFKILWQSSGATLYVDGTSTITKATNLPDKPLRFLGTSPATSTIDIVDVKMSFA